MALSYDYTGKYTSERHQNALESGKLTAGEAAKQITKKVGIKVLAKEVVAAYKTLHHSDPEWHHAGFYKGSNGKSTMGRTFFFHQDDVEELSAKWSEIKEKQIEDDFKAAAEEKRQRETDVCGIYYFWDYDYSGRNGKKVNYKVLGVYRGPEIDKPRNFTACSEEQAEVATLFEGQKYYGWDEPTPGEFTKERADAKLARLKEEEDRKNSIMNEKINWGTADFAYPCNFYSGAGSYLLAFEHGRIVASYHHTHYMERLCVCFEADRFLKIVRERFPNAVSIPADGSGTTFFARKAEDADALNLEHKDYLVPDARGGLHQNFEMIIK